VIVETDMLDRTSVIIESVEDLVLHVSVGSTGGSNVSFVRQRERRLFPRCLDRLVASLFYLAHLFGMLVIVRTCVIHGRDIEVVSFSLRFRA
jgi:hypothetical protein